MRPTAHLASGILSGGVTFLATGNVAYAVLCGVANVISDTDHILEYGAYCWKNKVRPTFEEFMSGRYFAKKKTIGVVFHAYEYLLILAALSLYGFAQEWLAAGYLAAFTAGYGMHMLLDTIGNDCTVRGYCIIYRVLVHFDEKTLCGKNNCKGN